MASVVPPNTYHTYKRDTQRLLYWIIHAFNTILQSSAADNDKHQNTQNVTGQVTVRELIAMAKTISKHATRVPGAIYCKLQSVIRARTAMYEAFQQLTVLNSKPDPEMEGSNVTHKYFIDALYEVFEVLGGSDWERGQQSQTQDQDARVNAGKEAELDAESDADVEKAKFSNKFAALALGGSALDMLDTAAADTSDGEESDEQKSAAARHRRRQTRPGKGKKKKGGKRAKMSKGAAQPEAPTLDQVPLESYRIIEDEDGIVTDYLLAVYALFQESNDLRLYMGGVWHDVAYKGLNGAVAATLAHLTTAMVKRAESAIMVEFPGHESYETVMQTITRGNIEQAQGDFSVTISRLSDMNRRFNKIEENDLDVKEQLLIYAYWDLVDFVTDFQTTRSGKPTKPMLEQIDNWNPALDLQHATKEQRLRWRRSYTINWLYDLVNVYSSIVVQRNTMQGENHVYEKVDWSADGQWKEHVRLYGINEFAGVVTSLAMQKPGTDVKKRISPSLVFQLQCIVDSLTVSRGWSITSYRGHVLEPPKKGFRPRRDVDLFLDRDIERFGQGYLHGSDMLRRLLKQDSMLHGNHIRHRGQTAVLEGLLWDFRDWLGESKYMCGLQTLPPSRFSNSNSNGLWEYSPFLCGAGLAEALELSYRFGLLLWDQLPEPMLIVHLHNMLVQEKYLDPPIGLFAALQCTFKAAFFPDGRPPTSNFSQTLSSRVGKMGTHWTQRQRARRKVQTNSLHTMLDVAANHFFRTKSNLLLYRESGWNPDRIPDEDLGRHTLLLTIRSDAKSCRQGSSETSGPDPMPALPRLPRPEDMTRRQLLEALRCDIYSDVCGPWPYSSLNFPWVTARMLMLFATIEYELKKLNNPTYEQIYLEDSGRCPEKRVFLTVAALSKVDEECLRTIARVMDDERMGWMQHIYWDDLDATMDHLPGREKGDRGNVMATDGCCMM